MPLGSFLIRRALVWSLAIATTAGSQGWSAGGVAATGQPAVAPANERSSGIAAALHGGRHAEARRAIAALLETRDPAGPGLALLAAIITDTWAPAEILDLERLSAPEASSYWYVRGVLAARAAWPGAREEPLARAREAAARLHDLVRAEGAFGRTELRRISVLAAIAAAQEERDELTLLLAHAGHLASQLAGAGAAEDAVLPFDELAGDLWLQLHRFSDALHHYRAVVERQPDRTRAWIGRARAARELGEASEAREAAREVLTRLRLADEPPAARPEMLHLATAPAVVSTGR
jgi:hypothetical protein